MEQNFDFEKCVYGVIELITKYFKDKVDKGGNPYIDHLYRVADTIASQKILYMQNSSINYDKAIIVAYLHDILEDTECTIPELEDIGCDREIIDAVLAITRDIKEDKYFNFIKCVKNNPIARIVKIADIEDNMDIKRLKKFGEYEQKRIIKYWYSWKYLKDELNEKQCGLIRNFK